MVVEKAGAAAVVFKSLFEEQIQLENLEMSELKTEYDTPWVGAAQSTKFDIKTYNFNPSIACRTNEWLSLGAGVNWHKVDAEYVRTVGTNGDHGVPAALSGSW